MSDKVYLPNVDEPNKFSPKAHTIESHSGISSSGANVDDAVNKRHTRKHNQDSTQDHEALAGNTDEIIVRSANGMPVSSGTKIEDIETTIEGDENDVVIVDAEGKPVSSGKQIDDFLEEDDKATKEEAEAGEDNEKWMTPLRTAEAIEALAEGTTKLHRIIDFQMLWTQEAIDGNKIQHYRVVVTEHNNITTEGRLVDVFTKDSQAGFNYFNGVNIDVFPSGGVHPNKHGLKMRYIVPEEIEWETEKNYHVFVQPWNETDSEWGALRYEKTILL